MRTQYTVRLNDEEKAILIRLAEIRGKTQGETIRAMIVAAGRKLK